MSRTLDDMKRNLSSINEPQKRSSVKDTLAAGIPAQPIRQKQKPKQYSVSPAGLEAMIWDRSGNDETLRAAAYAEADRLYSTPGSGYYQPYRGVTNQSYLDDLQARGVDVSGGVNDTFFGQNAWYQQHLIPSDVTGTPGKPNAKTGTNEQWIAYDLYQLQKDEGTTQKAESEWAQLQKEVAYWTRRGLTNEEIRGKIDMGKYKTLQGMDEAAARGTYTPLNRAVGYSQDAVDGIIWATRNGDDSGDYFRASVYAQQGKGRLDSGSTGLQIARRKPGSADWHPYYDGSTDDDARMLFDRDDFDMDWLNGTREEVLSSDDSDRIKTWQRVYAAESVTEQAEQEKADLDAWIAKRAEKVAEGKLERKTKKDGTLETWEEMAERLLFTEGSGAFDILDIKTLPKLDAGRANGKPVDLNRSVRYRREDAVAELAGVLRMAAEKKTAQQLLQDEIANLGAEENARQARIPAGSLKSSRRGPATQMDKLMAGLREDAARLGEDLSHPFSWMFGGQETEAPQESPEPSGNATPVWLTSDPREAESAAMGAKENWEKEREKDRERQLEVNTQQFIEENHQVFNFMNLMYPSSGKIDVRDLPKAASTGGAYIDPDDIVSALAASKQTVADLTDEQLDQYIEDYSGRIESGSAKDTIWDNLALFAMEKQRRAGRLDPASMSDQERALWLIDFRDNYTDWLTFTDDRGYKLPEEAPTYTSEEVRGALSRILTGTQIYGGALSSQRDEMIANSVYQLMPWAFDSQYFNDITTGGNYVGSDLQTLFEAMDDTEAPTNDVLDGWELAYEIASKSAGEIDQFTSIASWIEAHPEYKARLQEITERIEAHKQENEANKALQRKEQNAEDAKTIRRYLSAIAAGKEPDAGDVMTAQTALARASEVTDDERESIGKASPQYAEANRLMTDTEYSRIVEAEDADENAFSTYQQRAAGIRNQIAGILAQHEKLAQSLDMTVDELYEAIPELKMTPEQLVKQATSAYEAQFDPDSQANNETAKQFGVGFFGTAGRAIGTGFNQFVGSNIGFAADIMDQDADDLSRDLYDRYVREYGFGKARVHYRGDLRKFIMTLPEDDPKRKEIQGYLDDSVATGRDIFTYPVNVTQEQILLARRDFDRRVQENQEYMEKHGTESEQSFYRMLSSATNSGLGMAEAALVSGLTGGTATAGLIGTTVGFFPMSYDNYYQSALQRGWDKGSAHRYAFIQAATEVLTEQEVIYGVINPGDQVFGTLQTKVLDAINMRGWNSRVMTEAARFGANYGFTAAGEIVQEYVQAGISGTIDAVATMLHGKDPEWGDSYREISTVQGLAETAGSVLMSVGPSVLVSGAMNRTFDPGGVERTINTVWEHMSPEDRAVYGNDFEIFRKNPFRAINAEQAEEVARKAADAAVQEGTGTAAPAAETAQTETETAPAAEAQEAPAEAGEQAVPAAENQEAEAAPAPAGVQGAQTVTENGPVEQARRNVEVLTQQQSEVQVQLEEAEGRVAEAQKELKKRRDKKRNIKRRKSGNNATTDIDDEIAIWETEVKNRKAIAENLRKRLSTVTEQLGKAQETAREAGRAQNGTQAVNEATDATAPAQTEEQTAPAADVMQELGSMLEESEAQLAEDEADESTTEEDRARIINARKAVGILRNWLATDATEAQATALLTDEAEDLLGSMTDAEMHGVTQEQVLENWLEKHGGRQNRALEATERTAPAQAEEQTAPETVSEEQTAPAAVEETAAEEQTAPAEVETQEQTEQVEEETPEVRKARETLKKRQDELARLEEQLESGREGLAAMPDPNNLKTGQKINLNQAANLAETRKQLESSIATLEKQVEEWRGKVRDAESALQEQIRNAQRVQNQTVALPDATERTEAPAPAEQAAPEQTTEAPAETAPETVQEAPAAPVSEQVTENTSAPVETQEAPAQAETEAAETQTEPETREARMKQDAERLAGQTRDMGAAATALVYFPSGTSNEAKVNTWAGKARGMIQMGMQMGLLTQTERNTLSERLNTVKQEYRDAFAMPQTTEEEIQAKKQAVRAATVHMIEATKSLQSISELSQSMFATVMEEGFQDYKRNVMNGLLREMFSRPDAVQYITQQVADNIAAGMVASSLQMGMPADVNLFGDLVQQGAEATKALQKAQSEHSAAVQAVTDANAALSKNEQARLRAKAKGDTRGETKAINNSAKLQENLKKAQETARKAREAVDEAQETVSGIQQQAMDMIRQEAAARAQQTMEAEIPQIQERLEYYAGLEEERQEAEEAAREEEQAEAEQPAEETQEETEEQPTETESDRRVREIMQAHQADAQERVKDVPADEFFSRLTSVDQGTNVNGTVRALQSTWEHLRNGDDHWTWTTNDEIRTLNGFIYNMGLEGQNIFSVSQTLDLHGVEVGNQAEAMRLFEQYAKEHYAQYYTYAVSQLVEAARTPAQRAEAVELATAPDDLDTIIYDTERGYTKQQKRKAKDKRLAAMSSEEDFYSVVTDDTGAWSKTDKQRAAEGLVDIWRQDWTEERATRVLDAVPGIFSSAALTEARDWYNEYYRQAEAEEETAPEAPAVEETAQEAPEAPVAETAPETAEAVVENAWEIIGDANRAFQDATDALEPWEGQTRPLEQVRYQLGKAMTPEIEAILQQLKTGPNDSVNVTEAIREIQKHYQQTIEEAQERLPEAERGTSLDETRFVQPETETAAEDQAAPMTPEVAADRVLEAREQEDIAEQEATMDDGTEEAARRQEEAQEALAEEAAAQAEEEAAPEAPEAAPETVPEAPVEQEAAPEVAAEQEAAPEAPAAPEAAAEMQSETDALLQEKERQYSELQDEYKRVFPEYRRYNDEMAQIQAELSAARKSYEKLKKKVDSGKKLTKEEQKQYEQLIQQLDKLEKEQQRLTPEYERLTGEHNYIVSQMAELGRSIDSLKDKASRERALQSFAQVLEGRSGTGRAESVSDGVFMDAGPLSENDRLYNRIKQAVLEGRGYMAVVKGGAYSQAQAPLFFIKSVDGKFGLKSQADFNRLFRSLDSRTDVYINVDGLNDKERLRIAQMLEKAGRYVNLINQGQTDLNRILAEWNAPEAVAMREKVGKVMDRINGTLKTMKDAVLLYVEPGTIANINQPAITTKVKNAMQAWMENAVAEGGEKAAFLDTLLNMPDHMMFMFIRTFGKSSQMTEDNVGTTLDNLFAQREKIFGESGARTMLNRLDANAENDKVWAAYKERRAALEQDAAESSGKKSKKASKKRSASDAYIPATETIQLDLLTGLTEGDRQNAQQPTPQTAEIAARTPPTQAEQAKKGKGKVKSPQTIFRQLAKDLHLGNDIRGRSFDVAKAMGYYQQQGDFVNIRAGYSQDFWVTMHEVGHAIHSRLGNYQPSQHVIDHFKATPMAKSYKPGQYAREAQAELNRLYMMNRDFAVDVYGADEIARYEKALEDAGMMGYVTQARLALAEFIAADTDTRARAMIVTGPQEARPSSFRQRLADLTRRFIASQVDDTYAAARVDHLARQGDAQGAISLQQSITMQKFSARTADALLTQALSDASGQRVRESFHDAIFKGVPKAAQTQEFMDDVMLYWLYKHALDRHEQMGQHAPIDLDSGNSIFDRDGTVFGQTLTMDDISRRVAEYEATQPAVVAAQIRATNWWGDFMKTWMVDTGLISRQQYDDLRQKWPNYIPTMRDVGEAASNIRGGNESFKFKSIKGSDLNILNPFATMPKTVLDTVTQARRNQSAGVLYNMMRARNGQVMGIGEFGHIVSPDKILQSIHGTTVEDTLNKALARLGLTTDDISIEAWNGRQLTEREVAYAEAGKHAAEMLQGMSEEEVAEFLARSPKVTNLTELLTAIGKFSEWHRQSFSSMPNVITYQENGKNHLIYVEDVALFHALTDGKTVQKSQQVLSAVSILTRTMSRLTTGSNPLFATKNFARDFQQSVNHGSWAVTYADGIVKWARAAYELVRKTDTAQQYLALGGGGFTYIQGVNSEENGRQNIRKLYDAYDREGVPGTAARGFRRVANWLTLDRLNELIEQSSRYAEYRFGKHDLSTAEGRQKAFLAAQEATVNFSLKGYGQLPAALRAIIPFYNATLQGTWQSVKTLSEAERDRLPARIAKTLVNNMILGALSFAVCKMFGRDDDDKDAYDMLSDEIKMSNIIFPNFGGKDAERRFIRIPLTQNVWGKAFYAAGQRLMAEAGQDALTYDLANVVDSILRNAIPTDTIANPIIDTMLNRTWYGGTLEPSRFTSNDTPVTQRFTDSTLGLFRRGSALLAEAGINVSPIALQYLAQQYSGFIGQVAIPAFSEGQYREGFTPLRNLLDVFRNAWTIEPAYTNDVSNAFYSAKNMLSGSIAKTIQQNGRSDVLRETLTEDQVREAYLEAVDLTSKGGAIYEANEEITRLYNLMDALEGNDDLDEHTKRVTARNYRMQIAQVQAEALAAYEEYRVKYMDGRTMINRILGIDQPTISVKLPDIQTMDRDEPYMQALYAARDGGEKIKMPQPSTSVTVNKRTYNVTRMPQEAQDAYTEAYREAYRSIVEGADELTEAITEKAHSKAHAAAKAALMEWVSDNDWDTDNEEGE